MAQILSDPITYIKVKRCLVPSQTQKNNCVVKHWFKEGFISESVFKHLGICKWCQCAKIYGFLKLHKDGHPLRPIVSTVNTPYKKMSKYIASVLSNVVGKTEYHVKNSF